MHHIVNVSTIFFCFMLPVCFAFSSTFSLRGTDIRFSLHGNIKTFSAVSKIECAGKCLEHGRFCKSFSFSSSYYCSLSEFKFNDPSQTLSNEFGTELYDRIYGKAFCLLFMIIILGKDILFNDRRTTRTRIFITNLHVMSFSFFRTSS